ncbi:MAG: thioredoxin [Clostridia bacterium]|nr:thioredoxin [Clostridia bacterium]
MAEVVITKNNFEEVVMKSEKTVLLDFWATWCGPCMMIAPVVEEIAKENPQYLVGKVNVDDEPELAGAFEIEFIPTLVVIRDGKIVHKESGVHSKEAILKMLA